MTSQASTVRDEGEGRVRWPAVSLLAVGLVICLGTEAVRLRLLLPRSGVFAVAVMLQAIVVTGAAWYASDRVWRWLLAQQEDGSEVAAGDVIARIVGAAVWAGLVLAAAAALAGGVDTLFALLHDEGWLRLRAVAALFRTPVVWSSVVVVAFATAWNIARWSYEGGGFARSWALARARRELRRRPEGQWYFAQRERARKELGLVWEDEAYREASQEQLTAADEVCREEQLTGLAHPGEHHSHLLNAVRVRIVARPSSGLRAEELLEAADLCQRVQLSAATDELRQEARGLELQAYDLLKRGDRGPDRRSRSPLVRALRGWVRWTGREVGAFQAPRLAPDVRAWIEVHRRVLESVDASPTWTIEVLSKAFRTPPRRPAARALAWRAIARWIRSKGEETRGLAVIRHSTRLRREVPERAFWGTDVPFEVSPPPGPRDPGEDAWRWKWMWHAALAEAWRGVARECESGTRAGEHADRLSRMHASQVRVVAGA